MIKNLTDIIMIVVVLLPVLVQLFTLIAQKSHNQKLINLSERAKIVVSALEQSGLENADKKAAAMDKLAQYSKEVGIKVTADQLSDYIEGAVNLMHKMQN